MEGTTRFSLDKPLARWAQVLLLALAGLIPTVYVLKHYDGPPHFAKLIFFGTKRAADSLAEVRALNPPKDSFFGYDGQFYAQVAVNPFLTDPQLKDALDSPAYRSRRILVPAMAYALGMGRPALVLEAYALLNLGFWFLLLWGMAHYLKAKSVRDYLCIFAAVFTTGSMISLQRALTDLPASALGFFTAALGPAAASGVLAMALLERETSAVFLLRFAWPLPKNAREWLLLAGRTLLIGAPLGLWMLYLRHVFGSPGEDTHPFSWPIVGWVDYMRVSCSNFRHMTWQTLEMMGVRPLLSWSDALHHPGTALTRVWGAVLAYAAYPTNQELRVFELLAPLSLLVQVCYFAIWREVESPYWRMGVAFAVMALFLTTIQEEIAYCRAVLPMTIAFNIGLMRMRGRVFAFNFIVGNIGLMWGLRDTLGYVLLR